MSATSEHVSFPWTGNSPIFFNKWALTMSLVNYSLESQILFWRHGGNLRLSVTPDCLYYPNARRDRALLSETENTYGGGKRKEIL